MKILNLTLHAFWFNEILEGRKRNEYRDITPFWRSRLFNRDGCAKEFKAVLFQNGYATDAPWLLIEFEGITEGMDFDIALGDIIATGNLHNFKPKPKPASYMVF